MAKCSNICDLPDDCLINIFKQCDVQSLGRVASTCKRLDDVVRNYESIWLPKSRTVLGSNMNSPFMIGRSNPVLHASERCRVSRNWISGDHEQTSVMRYVSCMPWLCLEQDSLFVSKGLRMVKFRRDEEGHILPRRISAPTRHVDDVAKFVINGDEIISAGWDGKLCRFLKSNLYCFKSQRVHKSEVLGLDSKNDIVATGARDQIIKIWKVGPRYKPLTEICRFSTEARVLSLALLPSTRFLVAGLPGTRSIHPLPVYDIENKKLLLKLGGGDFVNGGGIIDIYPESENLILTCGYDTRLKMWDIRTPEQCVSEWIEPNDNILYTVQSDHSYTVIAGANRSGYFHVWDKRTTEVIQTHFNRDFRSPVYCLQFDAAHVFTALNRAVVQHCFMPEF